MCQENCGELRSKMQKNNWSLKIEKGAIDRKGFPVKNGKASLSIV